MIRARGIQSVSSPSIRWPILSKGLKVSSPSVLRASSTSMFSRSTRRVPGVRSRTSIARWRSKSTSARPGFEVELVHDAVDHGCEEQPGHNEKNDARVEGKDPSEHLTAVSVQR